MTSEPINTSTLPLIGEKTPYGKIMAVIVGLIVVIFSNYFLFHTHSKKAVTNENEEYTLATNPITQTEQAASNDAPSINQNEQALQQKMAEAKANDFIERLQASQSVGSSNSMMNSTTSNISPNSGLTNNNAALTTSLPEDPNTAFLQKEGNNKAQRDYATYLKPLPFIVGQGKFIFAELSVAINSDLPGQIEAIVSQDIYGEQGSHILIPRGSKLIGEYRSGLSNNQSRLFAVWTRLRTPTGVDVQLGSEGTDALGRAGMTGSVDYHFFDRFGGAILISMIGAGAANVGVSSSDQYNSASSYRMGVASALADQSSSMLSQSINIPPTIHIPQGQKIVVFVNRDLDFSRVYR